MQESLSAVIFKVNDVWHGQCVEHDIAARAKTPQDIWYELERAIVAHLKIAKDNRIPGGLRAIPPAPDFFRAMFARGLRLQQPEEHRFTTSGFHPVTDLRLSETPV